MYLMGTYNNFIRTGLQVRVQLKIIFHISQANTLKNSLNETVLLSTQHK